MNRHEFNRIMDANEKQVVRTIKFNGKNFRIVLDEVRGEASVSVDGAAASLHTYEQGLSGIEKMLANGGEEIK